MKKYLLLKIVLALVPAAILTQNWAWMSANSIIGIAFIVLWLLCIWIVLRIEDKNKVISQLLRMAEIGFFLLPISALVLTLVIGSQAVNSTTGAAQAGAAIGTAIGGMMAVVLGFIIGVAGGVIMHLFSNRYEKKITEKVEPKAMNFFDKHKAVTIILVLAALIITASVKSTAEKIEAVQTSTNQTSPVVTSSSEQEQPVKSTTPSPVVAEKISVTRDSIGTPEANVTFKNTSTKEIDGIKARFKVFNNFDEPVNGFLADNNNFDALSQDKIPAGASSDGTWAMYNFDGASKIKVEVFHVHFTDGTTWEE